MTEEAIFLDTLKFIRQHTLYAGQRFINIRETLWYAFSRSRQDMLESRLLERTLMSLNPQNQAEVELTAQSRPYLEKGDNKLESDFLKYLRKQSDIKPFMVSHFIKPNPQSPLTGNTTDNGVNFLKDLKGKGMIDYHDEDLRHVSNDWYEEDPPINKRWFDTLHQPMHATLTEQATRLRRLSKTRLTSYAKRYGGRLGAKLWKLLSAIAVILLSAYLGSGDHFDKLIAWLKLHFFK